MNTPRVQTDSLSVLKGAGVLAGLQHMAYTEANGPVKPNDATPFTLAVFHSWSHLLGKELHFKTKDDGIQELVRLTKKFRELLDTAVDLSTKDCKSGSLGDLVAAARNKLLNFGAELAMTAETIDAMLGQRHAAACTECNQL
ncbi:MAG TPA: hypothetical protein VFZ48_03940 [Candidatus Saccharimonadales bacterium]